MRDTHGVRMTIIKVGNIRGKKHKSSKNLRRNGREGPRTKRRARQRVLVASRHKKSAIIFVQITCRPYASPNEF